MTVADSPTAVRTAAATPAGDVLRSRLVRGLLLLMVFAVALFLRGYRLDKPIFWVDEAESCINALTILEHSLPVESYLGLPIYENTLTEPWPESAEYEFKDSSYSKKGLAIYHGWLPLYSMAASLKAFGIEPDVDRSNLTLKHTEADISRRTLAGRVPSVLFGMFFLAFLYMAGKEMFGRDAGWAALAAAAVSVPMVNIARQARYYSLTAALSAACCLMGWRLFKRGSWMDFILAAICFGLLFHTHILTFAIASAATATLLPWIVRHHRAGWKIFTACAILAAMTLPWIVGTGFLDAAQSVPKAIHNMRAWDFVAWPIRYWQISLLMLVGATFTLWLQLFPRTMPARLREAFKPALPAMLFLSAWIVLGFWMFMLLIPAASLFFQRLYLGAVGPGIVFGAILFAGVGRMIDRRWATILAAGAFCIFVVLNTQAGYMWQRQSYNRERLTNLLVDMRQWKLRPDTRIYATPNDHLTLTYYTGIPIQSIAPVRKSFLDSYPGDIVLIETSVKVLPVQPEQVVAEARKYGYPLTESEVSYWVNQINRTAGARRVAPLVRTVSPSEVNRLPEFAESLIKRQIEETPRYVKKSDFQYTNPSVFRGFEFDDYSKWWQVFFYRFVGVEERTGRNLNYLGRLRDSHADVLETLWTVYTSPGQQRPEQPMDGDREPRSGTAPTTTDAFRN